MITESIMYKMSTKERDNAIRGKERDRWKMEKKGLVLAKSVIKKLAKRNMNVKKCSKMLKKRCKESSLKKQQEK